MFNDFCTYNTDLEFDCPIQELVKLATMETSNNYIKNVQNEILKILNVEKIELESDKGQKEPKMKLEQRDTVITDLVDRPVVKVNPLFTKEFRNFEITLKDGLSLSYSFIQKWNELAEVNDMLGLVHLIIDLRKELASAGVELCFPYHFGKELEYLYEADTFMKEPDYESTTSRESIARCGKMNSISIKNPTPQFTIIVDDDTNYILHSTEWYREGYADFTLYADIDKYTEEK